MTDVCHRAILIRNYYIIQEDQNVFLEYDERTKKHLREMDALVNHNIFLSRYGKKIYSIVMVSLQSLRPKKRILYTVSLSKRQP